MPSRSASPSETSSATCFSETVLLVRKARVGDEFAFGALYTRHYRSVWHSARLRLGPRARQREQDIEDAVQETFVYAFEQIQAGKFDETRSVGGFRHWLATIVVHKLHDQVRRQAAQRRGGGRVKLMRDVFATSTSTRLFESPLARPSQVMCAREFEARLRAALEQLSERHRVVLDLRDHCEMSYAEVAAEMGYKKAVTVRSLYSRAKQRLRELLESESESLTSS